MDKLFIGLMSGTSLDGIDAVLTDFSPALPRTLSSHHTPYPPALRTALHELSHTRQVDLEHLAELDVILGRLYADAVTGLLDQAGVKAKHVRAIGSHGQTVRHHPDGPHPFTMQIGDPNIIAERTGITTVADFRRRDIAAGGQGAPLVPAFHAALFRQDGGPRAVLNLGGIANISLLPAESDALVSGFDTGPGNVLLDAWTEQAFGQPFDAEGRHAAAGHLIPALLERLLSASYFDRPPPKSTGRELFNMAWLKTCLGGGENDQDVQATLAELTAVSVARAITTHAPQTMEVLVCGGGVRNTHLMERLAHQLAPRAVASTTTYGIDPQQVEAMAFAWLAKQTLERKPGNLPAVTGASHPVVLGGIYPGRH